MDNKHLKDVFKIVGLTQFVVVVMLLLLIVTPLFVSGVLSLSFNKKPAYSSTNQKTKDNKKTTVPQSKDAIFFKASFNTSELGKTMLDKSIKMGYELITNTSAHIGPQVSDPVKRFAGNNLACTNCHLNAGTKPFAAPFVGIVGLFPQYRGRENRVGTIEERINGCMERSMNGRKLPDDSEEMRAMITYMKWISKGVPTGHNVQGQGFAEMKIPNRAVDLEKGRIVFTQKCVSCHGVEGQGQKQESKKQDNKGTKTTKYIYPPLWGKDTYNHGAGMNRVLTAAKFIKANMPLGATHKNPLLTDEEAYDVAGYINSFGRPKKKNPEKDFPDLKQKPVSCPYPPYADPFPQKQHQKGPFPEIIQFYQTKYKLKKKK